MHKTILASAIVVLLGAIAPAFAAECNCTYSGERPCFVMVGCGGGEEVPRCSCSSNGCATSCGPAGPIELGQTFSTFQISDMLIEGVGAHFGEDSGWKFVTTASTERETMDFAGMTFESLMRAVAEIYGLCADISAEDKVVEFKHIEDCE